MPLNRCDNDPAVRAARLSVAPMMDWTDRACRGFHRLLSRRALLYTEMVTAPAVIHGDRARLLDHHAAEHPVALQLGGSDPAELREATRIAADWGYDEINLNVGCPSDRVQSGCFGAVLMKTPGLVADCIGAMQAVSPVEVTVKCRIGVDEQEPAEVLPAFLETLAAAGVRRVTIHARKAWLQGLSPRENREIPPLDYPLVHAMKAAFPSLHLSVNGGIGSLQAAEAHLGAMDGVMIGRAAYHEPWNILGAADRLWGDEPPFAEPAEAALAMRELIARHIGAGGRMHQVTRHMLGLFHGRPGARAWKRILSERGASGTLGDYDAALAAVSG
ncbi:tRNA dihydrouridine(20/20a) synthase DusA [Paracoccus sp. MC1862]|uniref:tRNA dihydrouridine(20/20a) synthase DusA n=1 Tax=Paracoccus sp. MC1862 TaxID=2760307 RepID=UPI0016019B92|nr:tRNA dihydrouridine(20/20a) synthase DusA [Paracoccus sp. MC1862]MBB1496941.1 tRNA dihydrouridine(20/20a) synthase DusA [Paracoccus sp. MC1862]QQO45560.1 tRNA dihydrouridine(20/20a) synthase DusA [Paracoccus sp. MC1862]